MSSGTKISLAVTVLLVGLLAVYYGVSSGDGERLSPASANGAATSDPSKPAAEPERPANSRPRRGGSGLISESVERAADRAAGPTNPATNPRESSGAEPPALTPMGPLADRTDSSNGGSGSGTGAPLEPPALGTMESDKGSVTLDPPAGAPPPGTEPTPERTAANQPATLTTEPAAKPNPQPTSTPPTAPSSLAPPRMTEYVIRENDSMWTIALEWFDDGTKWDLVAKANPLIDPDQMKVGQKINLPPKDSTREPAPALPPRVPASGGAAGATTHVVASGDTLAKLARSYYGNVAKWTVIYDANRALIGGDPGALRVGMKLAIPPSRPAARPAGA